MALSDFVPTIWEARFIRNLEEQALWAQLASKHPITDGNKIKVPKFTKAVTIRDYTAGTAMTGPEAADGSVVDIDINKQKYFNIMVNDITAVQSRPEVLNEYSRRASLELAMQLDAHLKGVFTAFAAKASNTARRETISELPSKAAGGKGFLNALIDMAATMDAAHFPRADRWIVVAADVWSGLVKWMLTQGTTIFVPQTAEAMMSSGMVGTLLDFTVYTSPSMPTVTLSSKKHTIAMLGQGRDAVGYGEQLDKIEAYRPESHFADAVRGLFTYGGAVLEPAFLYSIAQKTEA